MKRVPEALLALTAGLAADAVMAENIDPADDGSQYAWMENTGWANAEPSGGQGVQVSDFALTGWIWTENVGWISLSCVNTASCGTASYGVTNDGHGSLGGFAWGENVGWVNFGSLNGVVRIDVGTGEFGGYAWGENVGWISFSCTNSASCNQAAYGIRTDWCQSTPIAPTGTPDLRASRAGGDVALSQLTSGGSATWHEVVRGELSTLRSSGGDFATATTECAADDLTIDTVVVSGAPEPAAGDGYWYLARRVNCKGNGTFDSGGAGQTGGRDAEIAASGSSCP